MLLAEFQQALEEQLGIIKRYRGHGGELSTDTKEFAETRARLAQAWLQCNHFQRGIEIIAGDGDCLYGAISRQTLCDGHLLRAATVGTLHLSAEEDIQGLFWLLHC